MLCNTDVSDPVLLAGCRPSTAAVDNHSHPMRITLVYFKAGGGHRAAAMALQSELAKQYPNWEVVLLDLFQELDPEQKFRRITGFAPEDYYNKRLTTGFTVGLSQELKILQAMIRMSHKRLVSKLVKCWHRMTPSMVVSIVPNFNRCIAESLKLVSPASPFVTIMTDMADYPPHFWVEPGYTEHLICGTQHAASQAIHQGINPSDVHLTSGMVLSPRFYDSRETDREKSRGLLDFDHDAKVGLVMFGGHGAAAMKRIATALSNQPLILMCGRNDRLKLEIAELPAQETRHVVGFTEDVAQWMRLADYFIGKPGPGSISEALHCGLPVIVSRNAWTLPQERWNANWIIENKIGRVVSSFANIDTVVDEVIGNLDELRENARKVKNQALYEIPRILEQIHGNAHHGKAHHGNAHHGNPHHVNAHHDFAAINQMNEN